MRSQNQLMKNILVPTDFSKNANNALQYAIEIANEYGADIHLVHTFHLSNKAGMFLSVQDRMREDALADMRYLVAQNESKLTQGNQIHIHVVREYAAAGISHMAAKHEADLIVMGTKGASGLSGAVWGSVASKLIAATYCPVLAVSSDYKEFRLKHIVLTVSDTSFDDREVLAPLLSLMGKAKAKMTIFNMATPEHSQKEDGNAPQASALLEEIADDFHQSFDDDLKDSLAQFVNGNDVDMVCMIRQERGFFNSLFHASATKRIIFDCSVPLLVLHQREE